MPALAKSTPSDQPSLMMWCIQQQDMIVVRQPQQSCSHQRGYGEIKRTARFFPGQPPRFLFATGFRQRSQVPYYQRCGDVGSMICTGSSFARWNDVRRVSWRRTISLRLRSRASGCRWPFNRAAWGTL